MHNLKAIPVTLALVLLQVFVFVGMAMLGAGIVEPKATVLLTWGANFDGYTLHGEWWRLFTNIFLHAGVLHLLVNVLSLYYVGLMLEPKIGKLKFLVAYIICGLAGSLASLWWNTFIISVGASGAVFGVFGLYLMLFAANPANRDVRVGILIFSAIIILVNIAIGEWLGFVDNAAHLGGLAAGFFIGSFYLTDRLIVSRSILEKHFSTIMVSILGVGVIVMGLVFIPKYPADYFQTFQQYLTNENNAIAINDTPYDTDEAYLRQLKKRTQLWQENKELIIAFPLTPDEKINEDLEILYSFAAIKYKESYLLAKSMEEDSYTYIDTLHMISERSDDLPTLNYPLAMEGSDNSTEDEPNPLPLTNTRILYDANWFKTTNPLEAEYYRLTQVDSLGRVQQWTFDHFANGDLQMKGYYEHNLPNGLFMYFYKGRKYEAMGMQSNDAREGKWQNFYQNGQLKSEVEYLETGETMVNAWDSLGNIMVQNGNGLYASYFPNGQTNETGYYANGKKVGTWNGYYPTGTPHYQEQYELGNLVEGRSIGKSGEKFFYQDEYVAAKPAIGVEAYNHYIQDNLNYPDSAKQNNIEGTCVIEIYVTGTGEILNYEPQVILGFGCEEEAIRLIKEGPGFIPAKSKGEAVAGRTIVAVAFKLTD